MEITAGLRDLLIETAESLSGTERRRFMANTLNKLQLGQRQAASLLGWGRVALPGRGTGFLTVYILAPTLGAIAGGGLWTCGLRPLLAPSEENKEPRP